MSTGRKKALQGRWVWGHVSRGNGADIAAGSREEKREGPNDVYEHLEFAWCRSSVSNPEQCTQTAREPSFGALVCADVRG